MTAPIPARHEVAIHEAGHAVVETVLLGQAVVRVELPMEKGRLGGVESTEYLCADGTYVLSNKVPDKEELYKQLMALVAGAMAEHLATGKPTKEARKPHWSFDYMEVRIILKDFFPRRTLEALEKLTIQLLRRHWGAVLRVANELETSTTLTGDDVRRLVNEDAPARAVTRRGPGPNPTPAKGAEHEQEEEYDPGDPRASGIGGTNPGTPAGYARHAQERPG